MLITWNYNTILTTNDFFGQFPCDFASTSLYDLSFVGSLVFGVFWGMILKKIEVLRNKNSTFSDVCYYAFSTSLFRLVDYCMLYDFVLGIFSATIFVLIYSTVRILFVRKNIK